jgi:hypothetical protein
MDADRNAPQGRQLQDVDLIRKENRLLKIVITTQEQALIHQKQALAH